MHVQIDERRHPPFEQPGEFLNAVRRHAESGYLDERLGPLRVQAAAGADEHRGDFGEHGGFWVPTSVLDQPLNIGVTDPLAGRVTAIRMPSPTTSIPARVDADHSTSVSGGVTVSRRQQTATIASSRMGLSQVTLHASSLFGLTYATEELVESSAFAVAIERAFGDQFVSHMLNERINGTGSGQFQGILGAPCLISATKESGQAAATIVTENILKMVARSWNYPQAVWTANKTTLPELLKLTVSVSSGGALLQLPHSEETPFMLLGRPLFFIEECQTLGTKGDLLLGTWSEYVEGTYRPMQAAESVFFRWITYEKTFKFWVRNDAKPWWKTVLTPRNGDTLSPFVSLDTRA